MLADSRSTSISSTLKAKYQAYAAFTKLRLTSLVVVSSVIGYAIGAEVFSWMEVLWLTVAGVLVTGASNGFNQIIEKDVDALMNRTKNRPLPQGTMTMTESVILATVMGAVGLILLYFVFNQLAAVLGALALFSYVLLYTPLKGYSSLAVFVGAFPGAIPPMLGYVAATADFNLYAGLLFATQFMWQFPHFWAIAWISHEDYKKAGYHLLPSAGKDGQSAFFTLLYTLFLIPVSILPWAFDLISGTAAIALALTGFAFAIPGFKLLRLKNDQAARKVMFASFFYLPIAQLILLIDKI
ncbi:MAG: heme o synthase [Bacteroidota bacterium]